MPCVHAHDAQNVSLEGCLLKPQMMIPGSDYTAAARPTADVIAQSTLTVMRHVVPPAIPGIMFLSGGQSEEVTIGLGWWCGWDGLVLHMQ